MARESRKQTENNNSNLLNNRRVKDTFRQLSNILGWANLSLYGTDRTSDVDSLNQSFNSIMKNEISSITGKTEGDTTSFLSKLSSKDRKETAMSNIISNQFMSISGEENSSLQSFIHEAYKNRLLEQADLHEVASQLIELSEAILITRDAIVSADVVEGRMSRTLDFDKSDEDDIDDYIPIVEKMEKKFKLQEKIKNFIIPGTLEYGSYYAYTIPYSKIFNDFMASKNNSMQGNRGLYSESTLLDVINNSENGKVYTESVNNKNKKPQKDEFAEKIYNEYCKSVEERNTRKSPSKYEQTLNDLGVNTKEEIPDKESFIKDINAMLGNITICNDPVPFPIFEEGIDSIDYFKNNYVSESGDTLVDGDVLTEARKSNKKKDDNTFNRIIEEVTPDGIKFADGSHGKKTKNQNFDEFSDCYIKLIPPTKIIPLKIMSKTLGYYYIHDTSITPLSGAVSSTLHYAKFEENSRQLTVIDSLAKAIVDAFNKDFLKENVKFKETIVEAINYYNLNEKRLKFQFIPAEFIQEFKIDEDENGDGQSMIRKSLFYAKLYLMLLLFKIMSIILNSNDMKVNYIKSSGIDKNLANKVQEIARIKQSRQINMFDLFNYTTLINKVGNGSEMFIPTGRSGERPIETEILAGQDIQLNTELLENLKNSYILGTGVPAALINYMNEADFAKVVEQNNTKFNGRVVNYQLDFNSDITNWYKKIMSWSTQIPDTIIDNFVFILQPPKTVASNAKSEAINAFQTYADFVTTLMYGANTDGNIPQIELEIFKKLLADDQLPLLNIQKLEELKDKAKLKATEEAVKPSASNGDNGDDFGLDDIDLK
jgi:hypothetical protein